MKQNSNIFIIIGVVALVFGRLLGLTRKEFFELDQLKQKLDKRYNAGVPTGKKDDWLDKNVAIIKQIRRLDRSTAVTYQKRQDIFLEKVQEQRKAQAVQERLAQISRAAAKPIQGKIEAISKAIRDELAKSPDQYDQINFGQMIASIQELKNEITLARAGLTDRDLIDLRMQETIKLPKQLADAVLANLMRLARPIIDQVNEVKDYIEQRRKSSNPFDFDSDQIEDPIIREIKPRLDSAYQAGLLLNPHFINIARGLAWRFAMKKADNITSHIAQLLDEFAGYIDELNGRSREDKNNNRLLAKNFDATVQAILVMKNVTDNLYAWLPSKFRYRVILIEDLTEKMNSLGQLLSGLKIGLYNIYGVEKGTGDKITILYDTFPDPLGGTKRKRSGLQDDLLTAIPPGIDEIVED